MQVGLQILDLVFFFVISGYAEVVNAGKSKTSEDQAVCVEDSLAKVRF
jgi:hypothetical protein